MKITENRTDVQNPNQVNYGLQFDSNFVEPGKCGNVRFFGYQCGNRSNRHWGYFVRKGFDHFEDDKLMAIVRDEKTGEESLKTVEEVEHDAYSHKDGDYELVLACVLDGTAADDGGAE